MMNALKLPMAGIRNQGDGVVKDLGAYGMYWTSSPNATISYMLSLYTTGIYTSPSSNRDYGLSIRCIKN
jgi:hypothetical protein